MTGRVPLAALGCHWRLARQCLRSAAGRGAGSKLPVTPRQTVSDGFSPAEAFAEKHMVRRLISVVVLLSLLLCGAAGALWAWSYPSGMLRGPLKPSTDATQAQLARPLPTVHF